MTEQRSLVHSRLQSTHLPACARRPTAPWLLMLLLLGPLASLPASHHLPEESAPEFADTTFEIDTHARIFFSPGEADFLAEYVGWYEEGEYRYRSVTIGGYYRLLRNLKAGLFYRLQFNTRHDDDWIEQGATWLWADTSDRAEHVLVADLTPRFLVGFLPGNWVFAVKNRYEYNLTNSQQSLLLRPGLTWFLVKDREPILNLSAQYATYLSLNFGAAPWYQHGPYVSLFYHLSPYVTLDVGVARQWTYWSESQAFLADFPNATYAQNVSRAWIVDLGVVLRF